VALREIKEPAIAESVLSQALDIAHNTKEMALRNIFISTIIDNYIKLGHTDKAERMIKYIDFPDSRDEALLKIIMGYVQDGRFEYAKNLSKKIRDPFSEAILFKKLIKYFSDRREYAGVVKVQDMIHDSSAAVQKHFKIIAIINPEVGIEKDKLYVHHLFLSERIKETFKAMINMSKQCVDAGNKTQAGYILERAIIASKDMELDYLRDKSLAEAGLVFVAIGDLKRAQEIAGSIKIAICQSELLAAIATAYSEAGAFEEAALVTKDIGVTHYRNNVLSELIMRQIDTGKEKEANRLINSIAETQSAEDIYHTIASYYMRNGKYNDVVKICAKINDNFVKFKILVDLTNAMRETQKNKPAAQSAFNKILN